MVIDIPEVQPFEFQSVTAFQERKELADKLNEVIDALNSIGDIPEIQDEIDTIKADITAIESGLTSTDADVATLTNSLNTTIASLNALTSRMTTAEGSIQSQGTAITAIQEDITPIQEDITTIQGNITAIQGNITAIQGNITTIQGDIADIDAEIIGLQHEVVDEVSMSSTTHGTVQVTIHHEDGTQDTSAPIDLALVQEGGITLQTGATDRSFNLKVTLSDGSSWQTNDFVIPEGGGTDVSVTSIQISQGSSANQIRVRIGLSDGSFINSNDWTVVTPAEFSTLQSTVQTQGGEIDGLNTRVTELESKPSFSLQPATASILGGVKVGTNITVASDGTISIPNASSSAAGVMTPTQVSNLNSAATAATMMFRRDTSSGLNLHISSVAGSEFDEQVPEATTALPGVMSAADKTKLDTVPAPATIATDEDISDIQEQISGLKLSKSGDNNIVLNGDSVPAVGSVGGSVSDSNLTIVVNGINSAPIALPQSGGSAMNWEKIDPSSIPSDFQAGDFVFFGLKITLKQPVISGGWSSANVGGTSQDLLGITDTSNVIIPFFYQLTDTAQSDPGISPFFAVFSSSYVALSKLTRTPQVQKWNDFANSSSWTFGFETKYFNGSSESTKLDSIPYADFPAKCAFFYRMRSSA